MKALFQKEWRENVKLAVLGFIIYGLLLLSLDIGYVGELKDLAQGIGGRGGEGWQPLLFKTFLQGTAFLCPLLAAVLGWFQIHNERHRDLWSFLVHRPVTRTQIFLAKAGAGLALYLLGAGLPFLLYVGWAITPGHVAAPFEWSMLQPACAMLLTGPAFYFAGMLTGLRQARWYASRGVPLVSGIAVSVCAAIVPHFWQALLVLISGAAILGFAAWGSFRTNGYYYGQPKVAKPALALGLVLGTMVITFIGVGLLTKAFLERWFVAPVEWSHYAMLKDGTVYREIDSNGRPAKLLDLKGGPLTSRKTGQPLTRQELSGERAASILIHVYFGDWDWHFSYFKKPYSLFEGMGPSGGALWYYWARYAKVVAFDLSNRRLMGSLGPGGFSQRLVPGESFDYPPGEMLDLLHTPTKLYRLNLADRSATAIFSAPADDPIGGAAVLQSAEEDHSLTAVATRHFICLLHGREEIWKAPYEPGYPAYDNIAVYRLEGTNDYALWLTPARRGPLPDRITYLANGHPVRILELPTHPQSLVFDASDKVLSFGTAPVLIVLDRALASWNVPQIPREALWFGLVGAAISIVVGVWLGRRYSFDPPAQLGWAVFILLFGLPGLLAFLAVQEWPAREPCPNCGRLRIVTREHCEHCQAVFRPAEPTGTEIFESLC